MTRDFRLQGVLDYVDQEGIDASTGTLGLRAMFKTRTTGLYPRSVCYGSYADRGSGGGDADSRIRGSSRPTGQYVLVVNAERKVGRVPVSVSQTISGWAVIESGLTTDSRVVIDGLQRARPGLEVIATDKQLEVDDQALLRGFSPPIARLKLPRMVAKRGLPKSNESNESNHLMSRFFIYRPIFASVISIIIVIAGFVSFGSLPVAKFPPIAPPTVSVTRSLSGR